MALPDSPSDWQPCSDVWFNIVVLSLVHLTKYCLDRVGAACCNDGSGCCSDCCKQLFPVCASDTCIERPRYTACKPVQHFASESVYKFKLIFHSGTKMMMMRHLIVAITGRDDLF